MKIEDALKVVKNKGLSWTIFRFNYEFKKKTGIMKRKFTTKDISDNELIERIFDKKITTKVDIVNKIKYEKDKFFIDSDNINEYKKYLKENLNKQEEKTLIKIADDAIDGNILCFSKWIGNYGKPINWHMNPITKYVWPKNKHWVDIEELSTESGDVKYVWEASRFPQIYYFIRAYTLSGDEKYAKAYWDQIESWIDANPYNMGINWKCGQEIAFRMFSWIFGLYVFLDSPHSTNNRIFDLIKSLYQSAIRIENNIDFAIKAVRNNHSISEAAGLFTFGILFPFFKDSKRLVNKGKKYLEQEGLKQIYDDGSYIQNSMNYHRLMLQDYAWCYRLADMNNFRFSFELTSKINKAIEFLYQMQDDVSGYVPNYGANDGALIFPLTSCDFLDYRPQLNNIHYILNGSRLFDHGKYDEELLWFCGVDAIKKTVQKSVKRKSKQFNDGGYYTFRIKDRFGMIKCGVHKNRTGSADMLHFDLWYKGVNILCDIGSYSYNPEKELEDYFDATENHNTVMVNNRNQVEKGPRFLTIKWAKGYLNQFKIKNKEIYFSGYHDGYKNIHTREVEFKEKSCIIKDVIENKLEAEINVRLNWNIGTEIEKISDKKYRIVINPGDEIIVEISSSSEGDLKMYYKNNWKIRGWRALYYGRKTPINRLVYNIYSIKSKEKIITKISW